MFDDKPVHLAMERIFTPLAPTAVMPAATGRSRGIEAPARRRRWFMGRDGIAAAGFALAITGVGLVAAPLLTGPGTPPRPAFVAPAGPVTPVAPVPATLPPPTIAAVSPPAATPAAGPVAAPPAMARQFRRSARSVRPYRARRAHARREAPRLYGTALQRALARDRIVTRRLNQQALARLRAR